MTDWVGVNCCFRTEFPAADGEQGARHVRVPCSRIQVSSTVLGTEDRQEGLKASVVEQDGLAVAGVELRRHGGRPHARAAV